jgi:hypothetical protein
MAQLQAMLTKDPKVSGSNPEWSKVFSAEILEKILAKINPLKYEAR